jgi:hypothetical protein
MPRHPTLPGSGSCHAADRHHLVTSGYTFGLFDGYPTGGFDPGCEGAKASAAAPSVFSGVHLRGLGGARR